MMKAASHHVFRQVDASRQLHKIGVHDQVAPYRGSSHSLDHSTLYKSATTSRADHWLPYADQSSIHHRESGQTHISTMF